MPRDFEFERYRLKINKPLTCGDCADFGKRCKDKKADDKICGEICGTYEKRKSCMEKAKEQKHR